MKRFKNLKRLQFHIDDSVINNVLNIFNEHCGNLEFLQVDITRDFCRSHIEDITLLPITILRNLKDLRISGLKTLTDTFLVELSRNCQELRHLELNLYRKL